MKKILMTALAALTMTGGVALADRHHHDNGRVTVRGGVNIHVGGHVNNRPQRVRYERRRVNMVRGRFVFNGGVERRYVRPSARVHYYNYRVRPQIYVENMAPVDGYIWVSGNWNWNGYEWSWTAGHYEPDPNYYYDGY